MLFFEKCEKIKIEDHNILGLMSGSERIKIEDHKILILMSLEVHVNRTNQMPDISVNIIEH